MVKDTEKWGKALEAASAVHKLLLNKYFFNLDSVVKFEVAHL